MKSLMVVGLAGVLGVASATNAALVITNSDIVSDHYIHSLTFDTMGTSTLTDQAVSYANIVYYNEGLTRYFCGNSGANGELTFKYDFSSLAYRPTSVVFNDGFIDFTNNSAISLKSEWSTDGVNWTPLTSLTGGVNWNGNYSDVSGTYPISLSGLPDTVYYRVTMTKTDGGFGSATQTQWSRVNYWNRDGYSANFTVTAVPEPAALGLLGLGGLLAIGRRRA